MKMQLVALASATLALGGCVSVLPTPVIPSALISLPAERIARVEQTSMQAVQPVLPLRPCAQIRAS